MVVGIYAVVALQALIIALLAYILLFRSISNQLARYASRRRARFEPHVLNLLIDHSATEPLEGKFLFGDRALIKALLLQQAAELSGQDRLNMTTVFERLGYVSAECRALRSKRWWRRLEAAIDLGIMQSESATPALVEAVADPIEDVRLAAVRALGQLNDLRGLAVLLDAVEQGDRWTGNTLVEVLYSMGRGVGPEITRRLESATDIRARRLYMQLAGLLRLLPAVEPAVSSLTDADEETRAIAAAALGRIGDPAAVRGLVASMSDESSRVRAQAARALGTLADIQTLESLTYALSDADWGVRHNAASALVGLGDAGIGRLQETLNSAEELPRRVAADVLAERTLGIGRLSNYLKI